MSEDIELLRELQAEREICAVMARYFRANDRLQLDELAEAYHPDAYDDHGSYKGGVAGLIEWIRTRHQTIEQSMHLAGRPFIELENDRARVETYCVLTQHERTGCINLATERPAYRRFTFGLRYIDRFERRDGLWKIAHRVVVWEWADEAIGDLTMPASWVAAERSRDDVVYGDVGARIG
ncbi:MAG TPA: nuclear transport factor 2 family protein [Caulobacteraceae bacterium]|nr:nuclear transport factor 2 family protein [Caulobacteraceae bacterium]